MSPEDDDKPVNPEESQGEAASEGGELLSQEELDNLFDESGAPVETPKEEEPAEEEVTGTTEMLSQEELDNLLAEAAGGDVTEDEATSEETTPEEEEASPKGELLSQDELDNLFTEDNSEFFAIADEARQADAVESEAAGILTSSELEEFVEEASEELRAITEDSPEAALLANAVEEHEAAAQGASEDAATQADLEALLSESEDTPLDGKEEDAPVVAQPEAIVPSEADAEVVEEAEEKAEEEAPSPPPAAPEEEEAQAEESEGEEVSEDLLDALIAASSATEESVGAENVAAAATAPATAEGEDAPAVDDLEIPAEPIRPDAAPEMDEPPEDEAAPEPISLNTRIVASLAAGILVTLGSYWYMAQNLSEVPGWDDLGRTDVMTLEMAMEKAEELINLREYGQAIDTLESPLLEAPQGPTKGDAFYLLLEARYYNFQEYPSSEAADLLHGNIEETIRDYGEHDRVPDALYWQAKTYRWEQLPSAALFTYEQIIADHGDLPRLDQVLYEAAEVSIETRDPKKAAKLAQQLQSAFPGSPNSARARLLLGDAYAMAGMEEESRTLYRRVADNPLLGEERSEAVLRLGKHAYKTGNYEDAIRDLDGYLRTTTETKYVEEIYMVLARSYRGADDLESARTTLESLLNFIELAPDFEPEVMVEYSEVLDVLGEHKEALTVANQITAKHPENPLGHKQRGILLGLSGNPYGAAVSLLEADAQGAGDAGLVLLAARHMRTAGLFDDAIRIYKQLQTDHAGTHAAVEAGIEEAELLYQEGEVVKAIEQLEELTAFSETSQHYVPALVTLADIYSDLDFHDELSATSRKIADRGERASDLAVAAHGLFQAGETVDAMELASRVNLGQLADSEAYSLLLQQGTALSQVDPERALGALEEAYLDYPDARTLAGDVTLLNGYMNGGRTAAARRMVMELGLAVEENPEDKPHFIDAAINWGDYLYGREDYRGASEAYKTALDAANSGHVPMKGVLKDPDWAQYQRANALLALSDFSGSLSLFEEIAASDAVWAQEAMMKAEYVRLEQQMRNQGRSRN